MFFSLTHQNSSAYEYDPYPEYLPLLPHTCISHAYNNHQNYDYHQSTHLPPSSAYSISNTSCHPHSSLELRNGPYYSPYNTTLSTESLDHSSDDDGKKKQISNASDYLNERKSSYHNNTINNNNINGSELYSIDHLSVATTESTRNTENTCNTSKHKEDIVLSKFFTFYKKKKTFYIYLKKKHIKLHNI